MKINLIIFLFLLVRSDRATDDKDYEIWEVMDSMLEAFGSGKSWYEILDVEENVDDKTIARQYRKLSLIYHPDKNENDPNAEKRFSALANAATILKDSKLREKYDHWLRNGIPFFRGRGYYFRKSENLSIAAATLIVLFAFSLMQYVALYVRYRQIKAGFEFLEAQRIWISERKKKKRLPEPDIGLFGDSCIQRALEWLRVEKDIDEDEARDSVFWEDFVKSEGGIVVIPKPSVFDTLIFSFPFQFLIKKYSHKKAE
jgi:hypothetical protein